MARFTYVMSDIHGQFDAFMKMLDSIGFSDEDELYIVGDVIDRGPKSLECIKWIMEQDNVLTLMGNHELMLYDGYVNNRPAYYDSLTKVRENMTEEEQNNIMQWFEDMPESKIVTINGKKFYLNHTQIASAEYFEQELTERMFPDYDRYLKYNDLAIKDIICIHGHIPTMEMRRWHHQERESSIWKNKSGTIIDIDCGAGYPDKGGKLGCLRLNDMKEFYMEIKV